MWHGDPRIGEIVAIERWNREFEAASIRRLLAANRGPGTSRGVARRVKLILEHMTYFVTGRRPSPEPEVTEDAGLPDAELVRLLALLAPDGKVLHVERVRRGSKLTEERDGSGVLTECRR